MCDWEKSFAEAIRAARQLEIDLLAHEALRLGQETTFAAQQAEQGMQELRDAGVRAEDALSEAAQAVLDIVTGARAATPISVEEFEAAEDTDA